MANGLFTNALTFGKVGDAESSAGGSGPMLAYAGFIVVSDGHGAHWQVHEYRGRNLLLKRVRRYKLETGAPVRRIDFDNYELMTTRERLVRVNWSKDR